jgi:small subunit ribosomal protein S4
MARYTGPDCKLCRREKTKLFLKGAKCDSPKCPIEIRPYPPGEHGRNRPKEGEYLLRSGRSRRPAGSTASSSGSSTATTRSGPQARPDRRDLLQILESRLDNVVYRAGFAKSRDMARQLVGHGHITVNGKKVDIPSYRVSENDIVEVRPSPRDDPVRRRPRRGRRAHVPAWLEVIPDQMRILVHSLPVRAQIDTQVQEQLIVEFYSK